MMVKALFYSFTKSW